MYIHSFALFLIFWSPRSDSDLQKKHKPKKKSWQKIQPHHPCTTLPLLMVSKLFHSMLHLMQCFSIHPQSHPKISAESGEPPTQKRQWVVRCWWCKAQGVCSCCLGIVLGHPNDVPGTAQCMLLFTLPSPAKFSSGCLSDREGEDAHTSNTWRKWMRDCSNLHSPACAVGQCHTQVWSL